MLKDRYLHKVIIKDLDDRKMVFIGGPRQVGKTTFAKLIGDTANEKFLYLNWDTPDEREQILKSHFEADTKLVIFDELHKHRNRWKNYLKGIYDAQKDRLNILVTGSARLDLYRRGGDSLLGRYHYFRLHPFSVAEMANLTIPAFEPFQELSFPNELEANEKYFQQLLEFGGFPEPLLKHDTTALRRWQNERMDRVIKDDIRDLESVRDLSALQVLVQLLLTKVGSRLSLNALREDFGVAHKTISLWVDILERFYYHFRIYPFAGTKIKSLRKEPKLYLWDWSVVEKSAARFENIIASHLLKFVHFLYDAEGYRAELHYLRDVSGREVDFLVTVDRKPWFAVEVKESDQAPSKHLTYFAERLNIPFLFQVVRTPGIDVIDAASNIRVMSADKFLAGLV